MDEIEARRALPIWSAAKVEDILEKEPEEGKASDKVKAWVIGFVKRRGILIGILLLGLFLCWLMNYRVEKAKADMRAQIYTGFHDYMAGNTDTDAANFLEDNGFQDYLDWQIGANLLTGDASKEKAIEAMVHPIAEHIACLRLERNVTLDGVKTYIWGVDLARYASQKYGSLQQVLDGTVESYIKGYPVRDEDTDLAREICTAYENNWRPNKWRPDLEFAEINADGSVTARNALYTDSKTKYWSYEE